MTSPARIFRATLIAALLSTAARAADLVKARDGSGYFGYKDTPRLPWCEWLVHDPDRPAPPRVTPGPAGQSVPPPSDAVVLFSGTDASAWRTPNDWKVQGEIGRAHV